GPRPPSAVVRKAVVDSRRRRLDRSMDEEGSSSELLEAPFAVVLLEGLDQLPELALAHDALEVEVPSQSMVGDPVLRIVVGPNALAPIAAADLPAALALLLLGA